MQPMRRLAGKILTLAFLSGLALAACAPGNPTPTPGEPAALPEPDPIADPEPGRSAEDLAGAKLVVYSGRSENLVGPIIEQFEGASGIEVAARWGKTAELAATLHEEGGNTPADVFFAQDPGGLGAVVELLTQLPDSTLEKVDSRFRDPRSRWVGISGRARVVVYNTERVDLSEIPQDLSGFADSKWDERIGWAPTNASFQTMVTAMRVLWGDEATRAWLEGILANHPKVYESNTPIVAAVGAGEVDVGFVNHYYLFRFLEEQGESFPARNYFLPDGGPGSLVMVAGAGVLEASDSKEAAFRFIDFLLSPRAQQYFASQTFEYPVVEGIGIHPQLDPLSELNAAEVDLSNLADLESTLHMLREVGALP